MANAVMMVRDATNDREKNETAVHTMTGGSACI